MHNSPSTRSEFSVCYAITTRWNDNDIYGHVNNVTYYSFFDTAVNRFLIEQGGLNIHEDNIVAFVVSSRCDYHSPVAYPENIEVGIQVKKLGNSSVTYRLAIFKPSENVAIASGEFVHVFVNRQTNKSVSIPENIRSALTQLV